jgi:hypothetical protein
MSTKKTAKRYGKVATLPKDTNPDKFMKKLESDSKFMEDIKNPRNKLWYVLVEKQTETPTENGNELHMVKYNQEGVDATTLIAQVKEFYIKSAKDENLRKMFEAIQVVGNDKFSIIKNVPDIVLTENVDGKEVQRKLLSKITADLIKLLKD